MTANRLTLQAPWIAKPQLVRAEAALSGLAAVLDRAIQILTITPDQASSERPQMARYWYGSIY